MSFPVRSSGTSNNEVMSVSYFLSGEAVCDHPLTGAAGNFQCQVITESICKVTRTYKCLILRRTMYSI